MMQSSRFAHLVDVHSNFTLGFLKGAPDPTASREHLGHLDEIGVPEDDVGQRVLGLICSRPTTEHQHAFTRGIAVAVTIPDARWVCEQGQGA